MIDHGKVESNTRPEALVVDEYSVWEATDIEEFEVAVEEGDSATHYRYQLNQYTKDDYILTKINGNQTSADIAIAEIFELMLGGL